MSQEHDSLVLQPCPFCGGGASAYKDNYGKVMVQCEGCKAMLGVDLECGVPLWDGWRATFEAAEAAVAAWNRRAESEDTQDELQ